MADETKKDEAAPLKRPIVDEAGRIRTPLSPAVWNADRPAPPKAPSVPKRPKKEAAKS